MKSAVTKVTAGVNVAEQVSENLSKLASNISHFEGIPPVIDKLVNALEPMKDIQTSLDEVRKQISRRPETETGVAREINEKMTSAFAPLKEIQSLLKEIRSDLANRPVPAPGVVPEALLRDFSHQIQQAFAGVATQRALSHSPAPSAVRSE